VALGCLLATAAGARAATVSIYKSCLSPRGGCTPLLTYDAAPGEANDVTISQDGAIVVRDDGAPLSAGDGCRQQGEHQAACGPAALAEFVMGDGNDRMAGSVPGASDEVDLGPGDDVLDGAGVGRAVGGPGDDVMLHGDRVSRWEGNEGNDRISATGPFADLEGGPGDDEVEGGADQEFLNGGPGEDTVRGLGGDDILIGDDRPDVFAPPDAAAADSLDGGEGIDLVSYAARSVPVTVDLSHDGPSGAAGEGDRLTSIEGAAGGVAGDVLTGDDGANVLLGGPGADALTGGPGRDVLEGGPGLDRISAGQGNDLIAPSTEYRFYRTSLLGSAGVDADTEAIDCGPGLDEVELADLDAPGADCETVVFMAGNNRARFGLAPLSAGPRAATFQVRCPSPMRVKGRCAGRHTVEGDGRRERSFDVHQAGGPVTVLRPPGTRVLLTLRYRAHPYADRPYTYGVSLYLDLPPWDDSAPPIAMG
jgi:hypothetical protein